MPHALTSHHSNSCHQKALTDQLFAAIRCDLERAPYMPLEAGIDTLAEASVAAANRGWPNDRGVVLGDLLSPVDCFVDHGSRDVRVDEEADGLIGVTIGPKSVKSGDATAPVHAPPGFRHLTAPSVRVAALAILARRPWVCHFDRGDVTDGMSAVNDTPLVPTSAVGTGDRNPRSGR